MLTQKIKQRRKERGYNQGYMANQLGITSSAYSKIERGETKIDTARLKKLSEVLEFDLGDFLNDERIVIAHNSDCNVNGYNNIESYHSNEDQVKMWERMFEHMKEEIASLRHDKDQLLQVIDQLTRDK